MRAVAQLDAKEQRMYADAVRSIADKSLMDLEKAKYLKDIESAADESD